VTATRDIALPTYHVSVGAGIMARLGEIVAETAPAHRYAIITDTNVGPRYAGRASSAIGATRTSVFTIAAGEAQKTRESWSRLTDELLASGFGRDTTIIALGGGVVGDLAGFVAATFMRGIPFVQVPTSLLAMIDASVGGKTGVDTPTGPMIVDMPRHGAAARAGVRVDDRVESVNGRRVTSIGDVTAIVRSLEPGDAVVVDLRRGKKNVEAHVRLGATKD
jgi:hypothetical protein